MNGNSRTLVGEVLHAGRGSGEVMFSHVPLSFMGGVDPLTGIVIDKHHPWSGQCLAGRMLVLPSGRGSCAGSGALFEMLWAQSAPAGIIVKTHETIITLGAVIAQEIFGKGVPIVRCEEKDFEKLKAAKVASINGAHIEIDGASDGGGATGHHFDLDLTKINLTSRDRAFLAGEFGKAAQIAMRIVVQMAILEHATELIDVDMAHIDGCFYQGPASLAFAEKLADLGGKVIIPSSMNSLCVDRRRWREQGVPSSMGEPSDALADAYVRMGVKPTYTCAPYALLSAPKQGQQIAWAESNAVVYANSVLGARTIKYPDYVDICMAIVGRAPKAGCHLDEGRRASIRIDVLLGGAVDDSFYAVLGYHVGKLASNEIPVICGLENAGTTRDDLKAFGAALATTSAAPMFHVVGVTPEAPTIAAVIGEKMTGSYRITCEDLLATWRELNTAEDPVVDLVGFGNPHFSLTECERLASLCKNREKDEAVFVGVTCSREVYERAAAAGYVAIIEAFGANFINDTCWCLIKEPIIPPAARNIMTNSGKYAHYGQASLNRAFHVAGLERCVDAACCGFHKDELPAWVSALR